MSSHSFKIRGEKQNTSKTPKFQHGHNVIVATYCNLCRYLNAVVKDLLPDDVALFKTADDIQESVRTKGVQVSLYCPPFWANNLRVKKDKLTFGYSRIPAYGSHLRSLCPS